MKNKKKLNLKIIYFIFLILFVLFTLTGCGKIKNSKQIKKYLKTSYNIDVEVLNVEEKEKSKTYTLKEKDRGIIFECTSAVHPMIIDGMTFGNYENTGDNYYNCLTKSIESELQKISEKYNVVFEEGNNGIISTMKINGEEIDFDKTLNIANEVMCAYNLKNEPIDLGIACCLYINFNGEDTSFYYNYTINGDKPSLGNSETDFYDKWNIPEQLEKDALTYINTLYEGESYIIETTVNPGYREGIEDNYISYVIKNDTAKIKKEYCFNIDKYREDLNNNKLQNMEKYMKEGITYLYE